jgi:hypothetical protein
MAVRFGNNEVLALAAVPMLSFGIWGGAAGGGPAPVSAAVTVSTAATRPPSAAKRHRPGFIWRFFHDGGNGGGNGGNGGGWGSGNGGSDDNGGGNAGTGDGGGGGWGGDGTGGGGGASAQLRSVRPGDTVTVPASGRRPGTPIFASLYGPERNDQMLLVRDLPAVRAGRDGAGVIRWTVTGRVAPGRYTLLVESAAGAKPDCANSTCVDVVVGR